MSKYFNKAVSIAQNAAKMSIKVSGELVDNARELNNELEGESYENSEIRLENVTNELSSNFTKEKLIGLKRLIILIGRGFDASLYFPDVVKNISLNNIEVKKLVYIYLLEYAESNPDLALLSINSFQKDLNNPNQHIRAMALRVLSGIRIKEISSIIAISIKKGIADPSPLVRKYAALAAIKLYRNDPETSEELQIMVKEMLNERSFCVIGDVVKAFQIICNNDSNLIHAHFHRCCELLLDADEWSQITLIQMLTHYARTQFENPNNKTLSEGCQETGFSENVIDKDHLLLVMSLSKLLYSQNNAVVMSAIYGLFEIAPVENLEVIWKPLMRVIKNCPEVEYIALNNISKIVKTYPVRNYFF
ncbi:hypothetical protein BB561_004509 [Smittium simulii]|uniref:Clathrin/coatomer adaptor adaptin-like N-terminal domain-containing protein n=1 Tax=Smittium simulii TaxID=133385 RepID=A0A2T9YFX3_9FUNG|nr:hypothetical protein BB561_004509 [Smittium simulii]